MCRPQGAHFFKLSSVVYTVCPFANLVHLVWARVCFLAILVDSCLGKGFLAISVKEVSNFGNSWKDTQIFANFGLENAKIWQVSSRKCQLMTLLM